MDFMKYFGRLITGFAALVAGGLLLGCQTTQSSNSFAYNPLGETGAATGQLADNNASQMAEADPLHMINVGDELTVAFNDQQIQPITDQVKQDGTITLIYSKPFHAAGKSIGELQTEIQKTYVPNYFKYLTVTIKTQERFYSVGGEVRVPGRQAFVGHMTVLGAIDTAGGFTDFSNKKKVRLTRRDGRQFPVNCVKALEDPKLNLEVFPGDSVHVPKRFW
ncbi:MAG: polysaccharide export protein [Pedosphaera sp.]|nr:polysaccharide export protein [Pedosphaera sp.]